ncbi:hypothetical protein INR49_004918, partial [Caranx melampygus]
WKKRKRQEKVDEVKEEKKKTDFKAGKEPVVSCRKVFDFRPEPVDGGDAEADDTRYERVEDKDEQEMVDTTEVQDIDSSCFVPQEVDTTGNEPTDKDEQLNGASVEAPRPTNFQEQRGEGRRGGEGGTGEAEEEVLVDENLFTGEDLEELNQELNTLVLED